jgi:hypothetical protein
VPASELILDTNIVRHLAEGEIDADRFLAFRREGGSIHLHEAGTVELLWQIREGRFQWDRWIRGRHLIRRILSRSRPIHAGRDFDGCRHIFAAPVDPAFAANNPEHHRFLRAVWKSMVDAEHFHDFARIVRVRGSAPRKLDAEGLKRTVDIAKDSWREAFQRVRREVGGGHISSEAEAQQKLAEVSARFARSIDERATAQDPPESLRWDATIRVMIWQATASLFASKAYNPVKHDNDIFDFELVRCLAAGAAICTNDRSLRARLRIARCWQSEWAVSPDDLAEPDVRRRLLTAAWPLPSAAGRQLVVR